ncbi:uncharacterized protein LOC123305467 [Chrysoperla carnea]|uniref:uncharacterized protein LOC123305467 n=1 Tax=Chrysoperla carnea TaxID=189513 RepID=UPI001D09599D|nr:uncharacterized protein LOC123305467 [Chrysoperla carnea]
MNTHNEEKPNKDEDYSKILGLGGFFQPLPESLIKNIKIDSRSIFQGINGNKGSSNKKKKQGRSEQKTSFAEIPSELTPQSKNSLWANIVESSLYYVEGQEKQQQSYPREFMPPPKFIQPKSNTNSTKSKGLRSRPSTVDKESKTKRSLRFTAATIPRLSEVKKVASPYTARRKSLKFSSILKNPRPSIKITTPKNQNDTSILNDLEELKSLKKNMTILLGNIQTKIDSNKENMIKPKSSCIDALKNIKNNDSLKAFELEEQLLSKTTTKIDFEKPDINVVIQNFNKKLCDLVDNFEINLFDYLNKTPVNTKGDICTDKNKQKLMFSSTAEALVTKSQAESKIPTLKNVGATHISTQEVLPLLSEDKTTNSINTIQSSQKLLPSTPIKSDGVLMPLDTPKTGKTPLKYNQKILGQYRELKFGVGNVLATPIVEGSEMRLNKQHNLRISQNVLKQLNSLDIN